MAIIINIDVMLAKRKMSVTELADKVGITLANISVLKNAKVKASAYSPSKPFAEPSTANPATSSNSKTRE